MTTRRFPGSPPARPPQHLEHNATAGNLTFFGGAGAEFFFTESASAGSASFLVNSVGTFQAHMDFFDTSTAAEATITVSNFGETSFNDFATAGNAIFTAITGGFVQFGINSTADHAIVTCSGAGIVVGSGIVFTQSATAAQGLFTANGATTSGDAGALVNFSDSTTAAEATFVINGGTVQDAAGAVMTFSGNSTAAKAILTANGGINGGDGGAILFTGHARGGTASISLFDNGELDIGNSTATAGVTNRLIIR